MRVRMARFWALFVVIIDAPRGPLDTGLTLPSPARGTQHHHDASRGEAPLSSQASGVSARARIRRGKPPSLVFYHPATLRTARAPRSRPWARRGTVSAHKPGEIVMLSRPIAVSGVGQA